MSKAEAKAILLELREDAEVVKARIQQLSMDRFSFKTDVWMGFKIRPSYEYEI